MDFRAAKICIRGKEAGRLYETEGGYEFKYSPDYLRLADASPVSLTMPLRDEAYFSKTLFSFFDGLIPEGWLLDVVIHNWKLDPYDRFGILLASCRDCIGNVSVIEDGV